MRSWHSIVFFAFLFCGINSACKPFEGIGNPGETYTTRYNIPGERIVPYTNPHELYGGPEVEEFCNLVHTEEGVTCM